jgi:peptidoglycan/LPS O-acetylase OafA/YrhL
MTEPNRHRFHVLDGWRGVCALLVALHHLPLDHHLYAVAFVRNSYLFVDFFFVLSGFVITHSYMAKLHDAPHGADFVIRRFGRLWPLHAAMLLAFVLLELFKLVLVDGHVLASDQPPFTGRYAADGIATSLLLVQAFVTFDAPIWPVWNDPSWSISTEFYTYLVFAVICLAASRSPSADRRRGTITGASTFVALAAAAIVAATFASMDVVGALSVFRCFYGFFVGHLAYRLWQRGVLGGSLAGRLEIGAVALVILFVSLAGEGPWTLLAPLVFAAVILVFSQEAGPVSRGMNTATIAALGTWSYSIYLTHSFFFRAALDLGRFGGHHLGHKLVDEIPLHGTGALTDVFVLPDRYTADLLGLAALLGIVAVSALTYRVIERPGQRYFSALAARLMARQRRRTRDPGQILA